MNVSFATAADCEQLLDFLPSVFRRGNPSHPRFETLFPLYDFFWECWRSSDSGEENL